MLFAVKNGGGGGGGGGGVASQSTPLCFPGTKLCNHCRKLESWVRDPFRDGGDSEA